MRIYAIALVLLLSTVSAHEGDPVLQADGGVEGDAPNACADVEEARRLVVDGNATEGIVIPEVDESDVFYLRLGEEVVGDRLALQFVGVPYEPYELDFDIIGRSCTASVFDANSTYYAPDETRTPPAEPFTAGAGETVQSYNQSHFTNSRNNHDPAFTAWSCKTDEWMVTLEQETGTSSWPTQIYLEWTDGSYAYVAPYSTNSQNAHAKHAGNLDYTLAQLAFVTAAGSDVTLAKIYGPCDAAAGERPVPAAPPSKHPGGGQFTVVEAGDYVFQVNVTKGPEEKAVDDSLGLLQDPPTSINMSCHRSCPFFDAIEYRGELDNLAEL